MTTDNIDQKAADVILARKLLGGDGNDALRDLLRRRIAGKTPAEADAAIVELFAEIDILQETLLEHCGLSKDPYWEISNQWGAIVPSPLHRKTCRCGAKEGQLHVFLGCDYERCPFCGGQLITCECDLPEEDLRAKGRIPFIQYEHFERGGLCARCGALRPERGSSSVSNEEWERYIEPDMRRGMLCEVCYAQIKAWIDAEKPRRRPGCRQGEV